MNENIKDYIVYIDDISKSFLDGKIKANQHITLRVKKNEVYALMGENGAGKSTIMSILFGIYRQDSGKIYIRGKEVDFHYANDAHKEKIGMVHQHFKLVDEFTVLENVILGNEICNDKLPIKNFIMDKKKSKEKIQDLINKYNLNINVNDKIKKLNVSQKQKVEILKLLFLDSEILIFDEPTAILSKNEISQFLEMIKNFKKEGKTVILITHKLKEVFEVAERGAIIKKGKLVEEVDIKKMDAKKISSLMVGKEISEVKNKSTKNFGEVVLSVKDLMLEENKTISFDIRAGEIFSIAGVSGNGQTDLISLITGLEKPKKGQVFIKDVETNTLIETSKMSINKKYKVGLGFVPEDRQKHGLFLKSSIATNCVTNRYNEYASDKKDRFYKTIPFLPFIKFINLNAISYNALHLIKKYNVFGGSSIHDSAGNLSGGNQQKIIIGRELSKKSHLLILFQPTRGLDIGAIQMFHEYILEAKEKGKAILLISYELSEIYALSDTISVISKNNLVSQGSVEEMNIDKVGQLMTTSTFGVENEK
ncbi:MAG: ABC transporter ATP-binding protein [Mycoplasmoidaceae bacterium]